MISGGIELIIYWIFFLIWQVEVGDDLLDVVNINAWKVVMVSKFMFV